MKRIVIERDEKRIRMALVQDHQLLEYDVEQQADQRLTGNFYKGRVMQILPGMQAAFVDIGHSKNGFLSQSDLLPAHHEQKEKQQHSITELVKVGQEILVQVTTEPIGRKGPRLTTQFSLPGKWLVYMPTADYVAVSRKIQSEQERDRLTEWGEQARAGREGFILRTASVEADEAALLQDLEYLRESWKQIERTTQNLRAPSEVYSELGLALRTVRDLFGPDIDELVCNDRALTERIRSFTKFIQTANDAQAAQLAERIRYYDRSEPIFEHYQLEQAIRNTHRNHHLLPSGGSLVIEFTEALTVVDVNTNKYVGKDDFAQTVLRTNLEAAEATADLLRVRDIGGIIIIDFIDMEEDAHRAQVLEKLQQSVAADRTRTVVVGWTKLGLVEMTRKKVRRNI